MKKIGEILVENSFISLDALNQAIQEQKKSDDKLGEILIKNGDLTEDNLNTRWIDHPIYNMMNISDGSCLCNLFWCQGKSCDFFYCKDNTNMR